ncbi:MAG: hypothetical protein R6X12_07325, partial [bacterium]
MDRFLLIPTIVVLLALALPAPGQDSLNCRQVGLWPVELSSFTAVVNAQNYVTLNWTTQTETNLSGFYLY